MTAYRVEITDTAVGAIREQARYIAVSEKQPENAARWLERVWDAVDSLESLPRRFVRAAENAYVDFEVRQMVVDSHLLLFTVDDEHRVVYVLGIRHGRRLPRLGDISPTKPT